MGADVKPGNSVQQLLNWHCAESSLYPLNYFESISRQHLYEIMIEMELMNLKLAEGFNWRWRACRPRPRINPTSVITEAGPRPNVESSLDSWLVY